MRAAIDIDLVETWTVVVGDFDQNRRALHGFIDRPETQHGRRQTTRLRTVFAIVVAPLPGDHLGFGQELRIARIDGSRLPPDSGEIRFPILHKWRRPGGWG